MLSHRRHLHYRRHRHHVTDTQCTAEHASGFSATWGQQLWPIGSADVRSVKGNRLVVDHLRARGGSEER